MKIEQADLCEEFKRGDGARGLSVVRYEQTPEKRVEGADRSPGDRLHNGSSVRIDLG